MNTEPVKYKGYTIFPAPSQNTGCSIWYAGYEITKDGSPVSIRKHIFPGFLYSDAALTDSIEHAKMEIDNIVM